MTPTYLAIENDLDIHERESKFWQSRGISSVRVTSMSEGICAASKQQFLYIGINASNIDYQPCLSLLRETTNDPILVATSTYTMQEQSKALRLGADLFGQISDNPSENYESVMALIERLNARSKQTKPLLALTIHKYVLLSYDYRVVFVNDAKVDLTKIEFELLYTLITNPGRVFTFEQLYIKIWGYEYDRSVIAVIKSAVSRLRKKIGENNHDNGIIENLWGVGYKSSV